MIATDLGYGNGLWLDAPAAQSLWRINTQIGRRLDINEAGRTWAQQNQFRQDYLNGVPGAAFALPPGTSIHEQGRAVDTDDRFIELMADHGWFRTALARNEPWHFEYDISRDNHRFETAAGGSTPFEEDDMFTDADRNLLKDVRNKLSIPEADYGRPEVIHQRVDAIIKKLETGAGYDWLPAIANQNHAILAAVNDDPSAPDLAAALAPLLAASVATLSDASIEKLADAVADEIASRAPKA